MQPLCSRTHHLCHWFDQLVPAKRCICASLHLCDLPRQPLFMMVQLAAADLMPVHKNGNGREASA